MGIFPQIIHTPNTKSKTQDVLEQKNDHPMRLQPFAPRQPIPDDVQTTPQEGKLDP